MFFTNWAAADLMNPIVNFAIGGKGKSGAHGQTSHKPEHAVAVSHGAGD